MLTTPTNSESTSTPRRKRAGTMCVRAPSKWATCCAETRWACGDLRRPALALAREVERRRPELATSAWWKEERHGVFIDYNQNAKDHTTTSAYSVRPTPDARVSAPLHWDA